MVSTHMTTTAQPLDGSVVLLRGLARQAAHWGALPEQLSATLGMPVYCPDLPGMGLAAAETQRWSLHQHVAILKQRLLQQIPAPWHLVGMSLGGMVALELALQASAHVGSVVLINSSAANLTPFYQRLRCHNYPTLLGCFYVDAATREEWILRLTSRQQAPHPALYQWQQIALAQPLRKSAVVRQLWAASRYKVATRPSCRGLVLVSDGDTLVAPACSERLANFLHWPLLRHPSAGHDVALDDAPWLVAQLHSFYQSLSSNTKCGLPAI